MSDNSVSYSSIGNYALSHQLRDISLNDNDKSVGANVSGNSEQIAGGISHTLATSSQFNPLPPSTFLSAQPPAHSTHLRVQSEGNIGTMTSQALSYVTRVSEQFLNRPTTASMSYVPMLPQSHHVASDGAPLPSYLSGVSSSTPVSAHLLPAVTSYRPAVIGCSDVSCQIQSPAQYSVHNIAASSNLQSYETLSTSLAQFTAPHTVPSLLSHASEYSRLAASVSASLCVSAPVCTITQPRASHRDSLVSTVTQASLDSAAISSATHPPSSAPQLSVHQTIDASGPTNPPLHTLLADPPIQSSSKHSPVSNYTLTGSNFVNNQQVTADSVLPNSVLASVDAYPTSSYVSSIQQPFLTPNSISSSLCVSIANTQNSSVHAHTLGSEFHPPIPNHSAPSMVHQSHDIHSPLPTLSNLASNITTPSLPPVIVTTVVSNVHSDRLHQFDASARLDTSTALLNSMQSKHSTESAMNRLDESFNQPMSQSIPNIADSDKLSTPRNYSMPSLQSSQSNTIDTRASNITNGSVASPMQSHLNFTGVINTSNSLAHNISQSFGTPAVSIFQPVSSFQSNFSSEMNGPGVNLTQSTPLLQINSPISSNSSTISSFQSTPSSGSNSSVGSNTPTILSSQPQPPLQLNSLSALNMPAISSFQSASSFQSNSLISSNGSTLSSFQSISSTQSNSFTASNTPNISSFQSAPPFYSNLLVGSTPPTISTFQQTPLIQSNSLTSYNITAISSYQSTSCFQPNLLVGSTTPIISSQQNFLTGSTASTIFSTQQTSTLHHNTLINSNAPTISSFQPSSCTQSNADITATSNVSAIYSPVSLSTSSDTTHVSSEYMSSSTSLGYMQDHQKYLPSDIQRPSHMPPFSQQYQHIQPLLQKSPQIQSPLQHSRLMKPSSQQLSQMQPVIQQPPNMQLPLQESPNMQLPLQQPPNMQPYLQQPPNMQPPLQQRPNMQSPLQQRPNMQPPLQQRPNMQPPLQQLPNMQQSPFMKPPLQQLPHMQPPLQQPPTMQSPLQQPPTMQPPLQQPPNMQPPLQQPPCMNPSSQQPLQMQPFSQHSSHMKPPLQQIPNMQLPPNMQPPLQPSPFMKPPLQQPPNMQQLSNMQRPSQQSPHMIKSPHMHPSSHPQQKQQSLELNPDKMPSQVDVVLVDEKNRAGDFVTDCKGKLPPLCTTNFITVDRGNCSPRFMRSTLYSVPQSPDLLKQSSMMFGICVCPMAEQPAAEMKIPLSDFGSLGPVRCVRCRAYMSPYMSFVDAGRRFHCPFCKANTEVPSEYYQHLDHMGYRHDKYSRPELCLGAYETTCTKEYCKNSILPEVPAFIFVIDVSYNSIRSGLLDLLCTNMKMILDTIRAEHTGTRTREGVQETVCPSVGFILYTGAVHFFTLGACTDSTRPQVYTVCDVHDMFAPLAHGFFIDLLQVSASEHRLTALLAQMSAMFASTRETETVFGSAVQAGMQALQACNKSGKLLVFTSSLPLADAPGRLKNRDDRKLLGTDKEKQVLTPQTGFYNTLAQSCVEQGCSINLYITHNSYMDIASIGQLARLTGGEIYKYTFFQASCDGHLLVRDLLSTVTRAHAFEAIMRVRTSTGVRPVDFHGHFYMSNTTDIQLACIDSSQAITIEIKHDDKLTDEDTVYVQTALLYTTFSGERRLRIINLSLSVCSQVSDMFKDCELDSLVNLMLKQGVCASLDSNSRHQVRDSITARVTSMLHAYRRHCVTSASSAAELVLPESLKLLPLYAACLLRSEALTCTRSLDERAHHLYCVTSMRVCSSAAYLYPCLRPLHPSDGLLAPLRCSANRLLSLADHMFLLHNCVHMMLYVCDQVDSRLLASVFGVNSFEQLDSSITHIPEIDNQINTELRDYISKCNAHNGRCMKLSIVKKAGKDEMAFKQFLVEDGGQDGSPSYIDYLCHIHTRISAMNS